MIRRFLIYGTSVISLRKAGISLIFLNQRLRDGSIVRDCDLLRLVFSFILLISFAHFFFLPFPFSYHPFFLLFILFNYTLLAPLNPTSKLEISKLKTKESFEIFKNCFNVASIFKVKLGLRRQLNIK